jgi:hypothetical protein
MTQLNVLKMKISRCTLMTKASPHGEAFYFSASVSFPSTASGSSWSSRERVEFIATAKAVNGT